MMSNEFYIVFGYAAAALILGVIHVSFGRTGDIIAIASIFIFQALYRIIKGRWLDWEESSKY